MLDDDAPVVISSQTLNRQDGRDEYHVRSAAMGGGVDPRQAEAFDDRVLEPQSHWWLDKRIIQSWRCVNSKMTIAVGSDHEIITDNAYRVFTSAEEDTAKMVYRVQAKAGQPIKVTKTVAYHTSRGVPTRELVDRCRRTLDRVLEYGIDAEFDAQRTLAGRVLGALRRRRARPAGAAAGGPLEPVPGRPGGRPGRAVRRTGQGGDRVGLQRALLLGHRDLRAAVPHLHLAADGPQRAALPLQHARRRPPPRGRAGPERRTVPLAHGQRRGGVGLLRRRHRAVPHRRRHRVRAEQVRPGQRRPGVHEPRGRGPADRDRADVGRPRLLAGARRPGGPSTCTG